MDEFSLTALAVAVAVLLALSAFFSLAETAMMAVNRYRLKHRPQRGKHGAKLVTARYFADALLPQTGALAHTILHGGESALALAAEAF